MFMAVLVGLGVGWMKVVLFERFGGAVESLTVLFF